MFRGCVALVIVRKAQKARSLVHLGERESKGGFARNDLLLELLACKVI
jgi:hypothetical protein